MTPAKYTRHKTGVAVEMEVAEDLRKAQEAKSRNHVLVITTDYGEPFNVDGFSRFTRAMPSAQPVFRSMVSHIVCARRLLDYSPMLKQLLMR
jgi:hypothetical protein